MKDYKYNQGWRAYYMPDLKFMTEGHIKRISSKMRVRVFPDSKNNILYIKDYEKSNYQKSKSR